MRVSQDHPGLGASASSALFGFDLPGLSGTLASRQMRRLVDH